MNSFENLVYKNNMRNLVNVLVYLINNYDMNRGDYARISMAIHSLVICIHVLSCGKYEIELISGMDSVNLTNELILSFKDKLVKDHGNLTEIKEV